MRHSSFAKVTALAAVIGLGAVSHARADVIVETFNLPPVSGYVSDTSSFSQFDPTLGTLHSVSFSFSATATFSNSLSTATNEVDYGVTIETSPLSITFNQNATRVGDGTVTTLVSSPPISDAIFNLNSFIGAGDIPVFLRIVHVGDAVDSISNTFEAETVTYTYTRAVQPPSGVPEAPSIAVLGVGLLGLGWTMRRGRSAR